MGKAKYMAGHEGVSGSDERCKEKDERASGYNWNRMLQHLIALLFLVFLGSGPLFGNIFLSASLAFGVITQARDGSCTLEKAKTSA